MKKHPFLEIDYQSEVKLSPYEKRQLKKYLELASDVVEVLIKKEKIIKPRPEVLKLSLLVCSDARIKKLNKEFRHKNKVTDVLSFPSYEDLRTSKEKFNDLFLGDLAICFNQTKRQAKEFSIGVWDEFIHLFFHGIIHLMGYDHERSLKEEKIMEKWEKKALDLFSGKKKGARKLP